MPITFPENTEEKINEIRDVIGRDITFNEVVSLSGCSVCGLDPVTNTSTDSFCDECGGEYWIPIISGTAINAHVRWKSGESMEWRPGGRTFLGDCRVQIAYSSGNLTTVNNTKISGSVIVDNKTTSIRDVMLKGVPEVNRIVLILNEEDKDG